jgi:LysM repeat protein
MKKYNIPASITLAQALLESGAGQSELARKSNNHFGIKCHDWAGRKVYHDDDMRDDCFRVYKSVKDSYEDHSIFLSSHQRYAGLFRLKPTDYVGWARGLKAAGYATSPTYADRLINIIESYNLDRLDSDKWKYAPTYFPEAPHTPHLANGLVYVVARQGDTMQGIADEFKISRSKLIRYNDLYKTYVPQKGDIIYLHRKNARAQKGYAVHIVKDGDSMYLISQMYGIRLARLYKMNKDKGDIYTYSPRINDIIRLR